MSPGEVWEEYPKIVTNGDNVIISDYFWGLLSSLTWWHPFWTVPIIHLFWYEFETSSRRHIKDIFFEMYSRRLKNVSKKTSFFETSQRCRKKDVFFEMYLRCLKDVSKKTSFLRCFWHVFEKSLSAETWLRCLRDVSCRLGYFLASLVVIFDIWSFWYVILIIFWYENASRYFHYLLSDLVWSSCNHSVT